MDAHDIIFTKTQKGMGKACHDGYLYNYSKTSKLDCTLSFYTCEDYWKENKCKARIHVRNSKAVKFVGDHNHAPNGQRKLVLDTCAQIKLQAATTSETTQQIIMDATGDLRPVTIAQMPEERCLKRCIQRTRREIQNIPVEPANLQDLIIPLEYTKFDDGTLFLLYDSGPGKDRICVFGTQQNLELLSLSHSFFSDGTFSTAPSRLFQQIYTIHAIHFGSIVPLIYALLPNKTTQTYGRLFQTIKNLRPQIDPLIWMTDFEQAVITAIQENFSATTTTGCFFHLQQCVWRKVQQFGLVSAYKEEDGNFAMSVRSLAALAFVPEQDVETAYEELISHEEFDQRVQPIADYFEDTWIGRPNRHGPRRAPIYPIRLWNVYQRTLNGEHRTNNNIEGWHRRFQSVIGCFRPSIFRCINALKIEQKHCEAQIERLVAGQGAPPRKRKYKQLDERISRIVHQYASRTTFQYLRGIAYNFKM